MPQRNYSKLGLWRVTLRQRAGNCYVPMVDAWVTASEDGWPRALRGVTIATMLPANHHYGDAFCGRPPEQGTEARRWWDQGTADETACRDEGLSAYVRSLRDCLESLARLRPPDQQHAARLAMSLAAIYAPGARSATGSAPRSIWCADERRGLAIRHRDHRRRRRHHHRPHLHHGLQELPQSLTPSVNMSA